MGGNEISTKFSQSVIDLISPPLKFIVNLSLAHSVLHNSLIITKIILIFKNYPDTLVNSRFTVKIKNFLKV